MPVMEVQLSEPREVTMAPVLRRHQIVGGTAASTPAAQGSGFAPRSTTSGVSEIERRTWQPLVGDELLERLRITGRPRPKTDPELAHRLRTGLEEGLGDHSDRRGGPPLVVTKDRLTRVLACEAHHVASEFGDRPPTVAMACGALIDVLFRQLVTVGTISDAMADGLAALSVDDHHRELVSWIDRLADAQRDELRTEVERQANGLARRWPTLDPAWLPRTQEAVRVRLAQGTIELSARVDLAIGGPARDEGSVAIVEIKSGARRVEHRSDLHFYALLETLRSLAPPFVVATYYTRTGELDVEPMSDDLLIGAARRTLAGTRLLLSLAQGSEPRRTPSGLCGVCAALPACEIGQQRTIGRVHHQAEDSEDR
jgi:PD-(D/E)XK nuclease superfamily